MKFWLLLGATLLPFSVFASQANVNYSEDESNYESSEDDYEEDDYDEEDDFYGDEDFVSIATGTKRQIHKAPAVASIITSDDIKKMGASSVFDVLESVVGLHVYPSNLNRLNSNISIRGIHTAQNEQVLIFVNNVKTTYEYISAKWELFGVGVELIDRIEVIRGPGSAIYGADAYSGVVNIITKGTQSPSGFEVGVKSGSFSSQSTWVNYSNTDDKLKTSLNAQWYKTDGDDSRIVETDYMHELGLGFLSNAPRALDTRREMFDIHAQLEYEGFNISGWYLKNDAGTGAGATQALSTDDSDTVESITLSAGYSWEMAQDLQANFKVYHQEYKEEVHFVIFPPGMALPRQFDENGVPIAFTVFTDGMIGEPTPDTKNYGANFIVNYSGIEKHDIRVELGHRKSDEKYDEFKNFGAGILDGTEEFVDGTLTSVRGTEHIYMQDQQRTLNFISLQDEWNLAADWDLTIGGRYDEYSDFGSTFNPRIALVWQTAYNQTTKFLYGQAFRAPSFADLYVTNNPIILGNVDIEPETISTYEISWDYRHSQNLQLIASVYTYQSKKLITPVAQGDGTARVENSDNQDGHGIELELSWTPLESLEFNFGYAFQNSKNVNTNQTIADAPGKVINASMNWSFYENMTLHMDSRWIMDRERLATDLRDPIDDYNWTNLSVYYDFSDNVDINLSVRNLFDTNAREASDGKVINDYPLEERSLWLGFTYSL